MANCINSRILPRSGGTMYICKEVLVIKVKSSLWGVAVLVTASSVPLLLSSTLFYSSSSLLILHFLKDMFSLAMFMYLAVFLG